MFRTKAATLADKNEPPECGWSVLDPRKRRASYSWPFAWTECVVCFAQVAFTDRAQEIMGGLERSQKFLDVAKVGVCGKMKSLEVCVCPRVYAMSVLLLPLCPSGIAADFGVVRCCQSTRRQGSFALLFVGLPNCHCCLSFRWRLRCICGRLSGDEEHPCVIECSIGDEYDIFPCRRRSNGSDPTHARLTRVRPP